MNRRTMLSGVGLGLAGLAGCQDRGREARYRELPTVVRNERPERVEGEYTVRDARDGTTVASTPFVLAAARADEPSDGDESTREVTSELVPDRTYEFRVMTDDGVDGRHEWTVSAAATRVIRIRDDTLAFEQRPDSA